jgi:alkanesulfonate monooxygenase SsuD/methylene tetrahydromethanopterin reductase-like flavin-dependent oxidoreductase (luciferase family)
MNHNVHFGVTTFPSESWPTVIKHAQYIEALNLDCYLLIDHFLNHMNTRDPWFEAWSLLAALATQTTTIRLGTLVTSIAWHNPAFLARKALTIDHISNGRLDIGLGTGVAGGRDVSHSMAGLEDWSRSERIGRFAEVVQIIDSLLRNEVTTFEGHYYQIKEAVMLPASLQQPRPPLRLAAHGSKAISIAAKYADIWNSYGAPGLSPQQMLTLTRERNERLSECCLVVGRDPSEIRRSLLASYRTVSNIFTSIEAFQDFIGQYHAIGISEFIFYYPPEQFYPDYDKNSLIFERIAYEVIPKLKIEYDKQ